jgi:hypothetical protein
LEMSTNVDPSTRLSISVRWVWDKENALDNWTIAIHNLSYTTNDEVYGGLRYEGALGPDKFGAPSPLSRYQCISGRI